MSAPRKIARIVALPAAVVGFSALAIAPSFAHVTFSPGEAAANSYFVATVSVPHGCDGSATTSVTISIPEDLVEVTPTRNALWDVTKTTKKLATPLKAEDGDEITEKVDKVIYTAKTPLPDGYRDAFELNFKVPDEAGKTLVFPVIQKCEKGETAWTQTVAEGAAEPEHPAPTVKILPAAAEGDDDAAAAEGTGKTEKSDDDGASKGLAYTGLGVGVVGVLLGAAGIAAGRRKAA